MGKMGELAAELEAQAEPCAECEASRKLAEAYVKDRDFAPGSYGEKLKEAFEAGYKTGVGPHHTVIDPPEGWRYGFPKRLPEGTINFEQWLVMNGYPKDMVPLAVKHSRYWKE